MLHCVAVTGAQDLQGFTGLKIPALPAAFQSLLMRASTNRTVRIAAAMETGHGASQRHYRIQNLSECSIGVEGSVACAFEPGVLIELAVVKLLS